MPDPTKTIRDWPPAPVRAEALEEAHTHLGRREDAGNTGTIVRYSTEGMHGKEGDAWCAFFLCQNVRRVLLGRIEQGDPHAAAQLARWGRLASGTCQTLWSRLTTADTGWGWRLGEVLPPALASLADPIVPALPAPGDIAFFGEVKAHHVGWVSRLFDVRLDGSRVVGSVAILSGNAGRKADSVAEHVYDLTKGQPCRFARLPW